MVGRNMSLKNPVTPPGIDPRPHRSEIEPQTKGQICSCGVQFGISHGERRVRIQVERRLHWEKRENHGQKSAPVPLLTAFQSQRNDPGLKSGTRDQTPASNRRLNDKATNPRVSQMILIVSVCCARNITALFISADGQAR